MIAMDEGHDSYGISMRVIRVDDWSDKSLISGLFCNSVQYSEVYTRSDENRKSIYMYIYSWIKVEKSVRDRTEVTRVYT